MSEAVNKLLKMEFVNLRSKAHGVFVVVEASGRVMCDRKKADLWEILKVEQCPRDPNAIILRSVHGKYITVPGLKTVVCNEADPQNATPIYPSIVKDQGSNEMLFMMKNGKFFSAQKGGSVEWNRDNGWGWETFFVTPREGSVCFAIKNPKQQRYVIRDRGTAKCLFTEIYSHELLSIDRKGGKAVISFVTSEKGRNIDYLCVDPASGNLVYGPNPMEFDYVRIELDVIALRAPNGKFVTSFSDGTLRASADGIGETEVFIVRSIFF